VQTTPSTLHVAALDQALQVVARELGRQRQQPCPAAGRAMRLDAEAWRTLGLGAVAPGQVIELGGVELRRGGRSGFVGRRH
jgi:hypothetical protein